ncbi:MAG: hypothetical protein IJI92_08340 [Erysipelotrichaceae bacterium]|nr:hypothetical protein [Erysipelotrichaceae bacterium]
MDLSQIRNPLFLKNQNKDELKNTCEEIRDFIIDYTSKNGGYLSGNLSAVEISVMLNKVFSSDDRLIFDGNDLNYTNKILNGMIDELRTNSNGAYSLANALGIAAARDLDHKEYNVVAVVNSTDLLSGRNIEALNLISNSNRKIIIVFNDDTTIDRGIGMIDRLISSLRNTRSYKNFKDNVKDMIRPAKGGEKIIENIHNIKSNIKKSVIDEGIFSEFNIDYIGPIDGHDLSVLERAFMIAREKEYPCVVHCLTTKGKGFRYAEACTNDSWNKVSKFDRNNGKMMHTEAGNYLYARNIAGKTIEKMMGENQDIVCVTTRNINEYGVSGIFAKYPQRCFDTASSAENSLSFASGLALNGKIPYLVLRSFELPNAFRILKNQIAKLNRPFIIGLIDDGTLNHDLLAGLNNIYIMEPENSETLQQTLLSGTSLDRPVIVIYPEKCIEYKEISDFSPIEVGKWPQISNNDMNGITILAAGDDLRLIEEINFRNELPYDLINTCSIWPLDEGYLDSIYDSNKRVFVYGHNIEVNLLKYLNKKDSSLLVDFVDKNGVDGLFEYIKDRTDA